MFSHISVTYMKQQFRCVETKLSKIQHPEDNIMLKMLKKMVNRHIRNKVLKSYPLHCNQFAYQPGMSTETAVHT